VVFAATVAFLALVWLAGGHHPVLTVLGLLVAAQAVVLPGTHAPLALVLYLGGLWLVVTPHRLDLWTLAAAVALTVVHLGCAVVSHGPESLGLDRAMARVWGRRGVVCVAAACVVWLAGRGIATLHPAPTQVLSAVALLLVLGWCALLAVRLALPHRGG
jgi:hypothetical protein